MLRPLIRAYPIQYQHFIPPHLPTMTNESQASTQGKTQNALPAVLMESGSSKGLFIHCKDLPEKEADWAATLLSAARSPVCDGVSSVTVVGPSTIPGIDVEFTFVHVNAAQDALDFGGSCGDMEAGVGPFAIHEDLVKPTPGQNAIDIRIFNTNTSRTIFATVESADDGGIGEDGACATADREGGPGGEDNVAILDLIGGVTGRMFPTGRKMEALTLFRQGFRPLRTWVTLMDVAEPCVLLDAMTVPGLVWSSAPGSTVYLDFIATIRREAAVRMGLAVSEEAAAGLRDTPKIALVSGPTEWGQTLHVHHFDLGAPHRVIQKTVAVCVAAAACIPMTVPESVAEFVCINGGASSAPRLGAREPAVIRPDAETVIETRKEVHVGHADGEEHVSLFVGKDQKGNLVVGRDITISTARRIWAGDLPYDP
ncbi:hypothetical protein MAPG_01229 [Magnaporthiopsis poae ATCC 64411]|uniref:Methylitaconate delta2-delta3-isomerase n=1 Tax=Magnaporthiopsis poae (strain ATCC 64411 / 73-15) TaxID=644358 RepID=A0A0C4DN53_MAGP6|nr:hypothetical protein MAPG_01229 [Magnaporthiopsis poae ATCC 64411]